jgi:nicotinamidase/pyrazinamidase
MEALIVVDVQNDFIKGGALEVPQGEDVIPIVNKLMERFTRIIATQDFHPANHGSFAANHPGKNPGEVITLDGLSQILWPVHCVQGTKGVAFAPGLDTEKFEKVFTKGTEAHIDSYSGFFDNGHRKATGLGQYLQDEGVQKVYICGLATDYCVKFTALDALGLGLETVLVTDACRGVNLQPGDVDKALHDMAEKGVILVSSEQLT